MSTNNDAFASRAILDTEQGNVTYYSLDALARALGTDVSRLPHTVKILLENMLRQAGRGSAMRGEIEALARWRPGSDESEQFPFLPSRVVLQDFTGVPAVVDLAAMRSATARLGGDPRKINPLAPADLVIDHSVQVDLFGSSKAFAANVELEFERNRERYTLLRWAQDAFDQFRVVPPGTGIVHQVNLEYLASVVSTRSSTEGTEAYPDTLVGTDSHTTMVNGLGVLGWGVGGIEAEAVLLGQPLYLLTPQVVGFRFHGRLPHGATATDLVLTVTQVLRKQGVVGKFVEFCGPGLSNLSLADRATLSNMAPEYGATAGLFPVDGETLRYLRLTGRGAAVDLVERYTKAQGLFRTDETSDPSFDSVVELDLASVEPSVAGPRRPQDRVALADVPRSFRSAFPDVPMPEAVANGYDSNGVRRFDAEGGTVNEREEPSDPTVGADPHSRSVAVKLDGDSVAIGNGSVAIAAITSCTNTSNPAVMVAAGLLAKKAVQRGLQVKPYVKTSMAPGSRVVTDYLEKADLLSFLELLHFDVVGYGCTTCIGNSGPLPEAVAEAIQDNNLIVAAVLSGNRNFDGRIHPQVRASYLASPPLVVAYALAGTVDIDIAADPIGTDTDGTPVYLRDLWPAGDEVARVIEDAVRPEMFVDKYSHVFDGDELWRMLPTPDGGQYDWEEDSTYIQEPPFFKDLPTDPASIGEIIRARALVVLGDSITTDHISPAGSIPQNSPAGRYLIDHGVAPREFNSYGSRRGNHQVMVRGTFGNIRLRNQLTPDKEGDWTAYQPGGEVMRIYDASERYRDAGVPLVAIAGTEYGSGSSRDWAAKGTMLLGIKAVIAESYERIHRSNLVGMGVLPLQFLPQQNRASLGLSGTEEFDIVGLGDDLRAGQRVTVRTRAVNGTESSFETVVRIDSPIEVAYYRHGGVLPYVLRQLMAR